jgi:hypothetical protein
MATKPKNAEQVRSLLDKLSASEGAAAAPPVIQEAKPRGKPGRKMRRREGVKHVRISPAIPEDLKIEMDVAIKTRFREDCPTIDTFIERAVRELLAK